jgi:hypothetical protein
MSSGSELGAGAGVVGAGAWSCWSMGAMARAGGGPTRDLGKHLSSFLLLWSCAAAQRSEEGNVAL